MAHATVSHQAASFDRQGFTEEDFIDFTPELHKKALEIASQYKLGPLFTPPSLMADGKERYAGHAERMGLG